MTSEVGPGTRVPVSFLFGRVDLNCRTKDAGEEATAAAAGVCGCCCRYRWTVCAGLVRLGSPMSRHGHAAPAGPLGAGPPLQPVRHAASRSGPAPPLTVTGLIQARRPSSSSARPELSLNRDQYSPPSYKYLPSIGRIPKQMSICPSRTCPTRPGPVRSGQVRVSASPARELPLLSPGRAAAEGAPPHAVR